MCACVRVVPTTSTITTLSFSQALLAPAVLLWLRVPWLRSSRMFRRASVPAPRGVVFWAPLLPSPWPPLP